MSIIVTQSCTLGWHMQTASVKKANIFHNLHCSWFYGMYHKLITGSVFNLKWLKFFLVASIQLHSSNGLTSSLDVQHYSVRCQNWHFKSKLVFLTPSVWRLLRLRIGWDWCHDEPLLVMQAFLQTNITLPGAVTQKTIFVSQQRLISRPCLTPSVSMTSTIW